jgi:hypothetical protein
MTEEATREVAARCSKLADKLTNVRAKLHQLHRGAYDADRLGSGWTDFIGECDTFFTDSVYFERTLNAVLKV